MSEKKKAYLEASTNKVKKGNKCLVKGSALENVVCQLLKVKLL